MSDIASNRQFERRWKLIQVKLTRIAGLLRYQGSLVQKPIKGHLYWYLRVHETSQTGARVHRSIFLGRNEQIVAKVRELLAALRAEQADHERVLAFSRLVCRLSRRVLKRLKS